MPEKIGVGFAWIRRNDSPGNRGAERTGDVMGLSPANSYVTHAKMWTDGDYQKAINALNLARTQLEPDGRNCVVCGDTGHQAWECHFNPVAMANEAWKLRNTWVCYHCGEVFDNVRDAADHFGNRKQDYAKCKMELSALRAKVAELAKIVDKLPKRRRKERSREVA